MRIAIGFDHAGVPLRARLGRRVLVAAAKIHGIRAATVHDTYTAHQAVEHDDLNVLCLGGRVIGVEMAAEIVRAYLAASFSGEERHVRRLAEVAEIERTGGAGAFGASEISQSEISGGGVER